MVKKDNLILLGGILLVVGLGMSFVLSDSNEPIIEPKNVIDCNVELGHPLVGEINIRDVDCKKTGEKLFCHDFIPFSVVDAVIDRVYDEGRIVVSSGNDQKVMKYELLLTQKGTYGFELCSETTWGEVEVYNKNNALINSESWEVS